MNAEKVALPNVNIASSDDLPRKIEQKLLEVRYSYDDNLEMLYLLCVLEMADKMKKEV